MENLAKIVSEAERIKDRLRGAATERELEIVCDEERQNVLSLADSGPTARELAIHISNLKKYRFAILRASPALWQNRRAG
jgi:hypothetical protein